MSKTTSLLIVAPFLPILAIGWAIDALVTCLVDFLEKRFDDLGWFQ